MATINDRNTVNRIIAANGHYDGDDIIAVVEYNNIFDGGIAYGLIFNGEDINRYHSVHAATVLPRFLWRREGH